LQYYVTILFMTELLVHIKPLLVIFHVLSVVVGMGSAIVADLICFRYGYHKVLSRQTVGTVRFLSHVVTFALLAILGTGFLLFLSDVERYSASVKFLTKMSIVGVLTINGLLLHRLIFPHLGDENVLTSKKSRGVRKLGFALGAVSVASWIGALSLATLPSIPISYALAIQVYIAILAIAVFISLILEHYLLEHHKRRQSH